MANVKQNDWVAINLLNDGVDIATLHSNGINSLNTGIKPKEDYLKSDTVRSFFEDENNTFNEAKFDEAYDSLLESFTAFSEIDQEQ